MTISNNLHLKFWCISEFQSVCLRWIWRQCCIKLHENRFYCPNRLFVHLY